MNKIVTYNQAIALKSLGFDVPCAAWYNYKAELRDHIVETTSSNTGSFTKMPDCADAPDLYDAAAWLRRNGWHVQPMLNGVRSMYFVRVYELIGNGDVIEGERQFDEYDDAVSHGIDLAIKRLNHGKL
jgi:hypothetical protein